jgi:hypothetical protein
MGYLTPFSGAEIPPVTQFLYLTATVRRNDSGGGTSSLSDHLNRPPGPARAPAAEDCPRIMARSWWYVKTDFGQWATCNEREDKKTQGDAFLRKSSHLRPA